MQKVVLFIFVFLLTIIQPTLLFAQESTPSATPKSTLTINYEKTNPSDDYQYAFKRVQEKILLTIYSLFPNTKANYLKHLLDIRLAELKYVVEKKDIGNIETTSQRFAGTAGNLTDYIKQKSLDSLKDPVKQQLQQQIPALEQIRDNYSANSAGWLFVQHDINYLKLYLSQLSQ